MDKQESIWKTRRRTFVTNFIGGIGSALGATLGFALVIALLTLILKNFSFIPILGNFITEIIKFIVQKNPSLLAK